MNHNGKKEEWDRLAIVSFVLSLGFPIPLLNLIIGPAAIALGLKALMDIRESKRGRGRYLAAAAILIGMLPYWFYLWSYLEENIEKAGISEDQFIIIVSALTLTIILTASLILRTYLSFRDLLEIKKSKKEKYLVSAAVISGTLPYWIYLSTQIGKVETPEDQFRMIVTALHLAIILTTLLTLRKLKLL